MQQKIIILDFGSQTTQLIARRLRELDTFCEILPYNKFPQDDKEVIGVILAGSPYSVYDPEAFKVDLTQFLGRLPVLGICYGAQFISYNNGGNVEPAGSREYGRQNLTTINKECPLFRGFDNNSQVWMSHGDTITAIPTGSEVVASTETVENAAYYCPDATLMGSYDGHQPVMGVQFHPEVFHSVQGTQLLKNFVVDICGGRQDWSADNYIETTVKELKEQIGNDRVILGLSGGVDSSVAAVLLNRAIGNQLTCIFVDHGMLRKNEFSQVMEDYKVLGLNVIGVDASEKFFADLAGVTDPEQKRKIIGRDFVEVFNAEAKKITDAKWLAQGTIYPDRIESLNITGKVIKSHHNVGGLPEEMHLSLCEPLKWLFKDEVRRVGRSLGMPEHLITRHPFPGPGLAVRILGDITPERVRVLQDADDIFIRGLRDYKVKLSGDEARRVLAAGVPAEMTDGEIEVSLYDQVWQAGAVLLATVRSVGVMGDERTYEHPVALRAVTSTDAMTADWAHLPYDFMAKVSTEIINKVKGVNRVCYDISSKPPATIEWE
ncbi:GMP synthase (glutamine-hydrolyzing) [Prevotella sp. P3-120]|uniref:GMP synthase [glutamine-hydrolyzing] n=1 Tax=Xylanibacter brevis TaxID=83231 RepID=A0ABS9CF31_9BACT|nr:MULTISPECIES: glutamine-hydrolyzing GMP synthase [Prevotellaceae]MBS7319291.1 glutamine-hydrolyzing GMP synthase [Prevotella sp.]MCF2563696.1 glutamine-hydrolyzing GMP synthase [Xylanibacter brevis]MCI7002413.1 glutamine-hydrolyzing GMP synthase [Prevotella sp.]MEE1141298.1 glutamine-hydrolyzing GMP synthase [Prevotella sp.]OYP39828.1 GMP synthase (glutamine-hydrolyzing) [Prevotella sp. P5-50]